jgi:hypothetical protein
MTTLTRMTVAGLALMVAGVVTATAQSNSGSITATAVVQSPLNVTPVSNLDFGPVFPGVNKTVAVTDGTAGRLDVVGAASNLVNISFTALPTNLTNGGNNMPIGTYTGLVNTSATCTSGSGSAFSPSAGTSATLNGSGGLCVFVGATVSPPSNLVAGTYSGTITMQVLY